MEFLEGFELRPVTPLNIPRFKSTAESPNPLGPLANLEGTWTGQGFNTIWRPNQVGLPGQPANQDRFLELNLTTETLTFTRIPGEITNRGFLQPDIQMFGLTYLQQITDSIANVGIHVEPGIWATVPLTTQPPEGPTVVRMASIPHGTTMNAQGQSLVVNGGPQIDPVIITPFVIGNPAQTVQFPESNLSIPTLFRSPQPPQLSEISQTMVDNPNSVLKAAIQGQTITQTTVLSVSTTAALPMVGGGTDNTAFLQGLPANPPTNPPLSNAQSALVTAIFWIESVAASAVSPAFLQLQYTQTVLLNFNGLSWPHVSVATLRLQPHHRK
jgi:hypothetical protein